MGDQAANNALAAISAHLHPGQWQKTERAEENLRSFNKWFEAFTHWTNVCLRGINMDDSMRWDMLIAAGGDDLHNIIKEAEIQPIKRDPQNEIPHAPYQPPVPRGPNGDPPGSEAVPEQPHVPAVTQLIPTKWDVGLKMIRDTISKYSNDIQQRAILMTEMPPSNYEDWRTWGLALKEQSQRCLWGKHYTWETAALEALLYQCPDEHWKTKILAGKWDFQTALDYGIRTITAKKTAKDLTLNKDANGTKREEESLGRVDQSTLPFCKFCVDRHAVDNCPATSKACIACNQKGHVPKSWICPRNAKNNGGRNGNQCGNGRGNGNQRGNGRGRGGRPNQGGNNQSGGASTQTNTSTVFRREGNQWVRKKRTETVNFVEEDYPDDDQYDEGDFEYDMGRLESLNKLGPQEDPTFVRVTPTHDTQFRTRVPWTTDSGVRKSLLAEKHYWKLRSHNPDIKLRHTEVKFRPYSTSATVPLLGSLDVKLTNNNGKTHQTRLYVTKGQHESLLGKEDGMALGLIKLSKDGDYPDEPVRCITPEVKDDDITGIVSGGQTQKEIDQVMDQIVQENQEVFKGMGRAKIDPIHIQLKEDAIPVTQGKRPIPIQLREATLKKLQELKEHDLIEGPLPISECKGWVTNMVITKKKWDSDEVRINIDTKRMNDQLVPTKIPIPTPEQLRHKMEGSDRFTAVDCRDSYFHFLLDPESQDLFKFHG